jgi:hypothetical protein
VDERETTQELRLRQLRREQEEREQAQTAVSEKDAAAHARRADKTAYLRKRLEERAEAERENEGGERPAS